MIKHKPLLQCQMVQLKPPALWTKIDVKKKSKSNFTFIIQNKVTKGNIE